MSVLEKILAEKRREIASLGEAPRATRATLDVAAALRRPASLALIAEVKRKSPSAGALSCVLAPDARAEAYVRAGAAMVSVLCDAPFFDGCFAHLAAARARLDAAGLSAPLLAKEFVLDEAQIAHARGHGADAVLLIARIVSAPRLRELVVSARAASLEPFVEVVDERELDAALSADARVIGVNARDLDTLAIDHARTARVVAAIPRDTIAVHLSGVKSEADVRTVASGRADAALVGEILMRQDDPTALLASFVSAAAR